MSGALTAQEYKLNLSLGNKAAELDYTITTKSEMIWGIGGSLTDSKLVAKRANQFAQKHYIYTDYVPAIFALGGANFDRLNIVGKIGACYIDQEVDGVKDDKKYYFSIGMIINYSLNERLGISISFDNVNAGMVGLSYKL